MKLKKPMFEIWDEYFNDSEEDTYKTDNVKK